MEQTAPSPAATAVIFAGSVALLAGGLLLGFALLPRAFVPAEAATVGKPAPNTKFHFVLNAPEGSDSSSASLASFRGSPVVLDFWATWCGPCRAESPIVNSLAQRYRDQGLVVVGVNTSDEEGNAQAYGAQHHLSFPIAFDEGSAMARAFGVENLPTLVVVGRDGKIAAVRTGVTSADELDRLVKKCL